VPPFIRRSLSRDLPLCIVGLLIVSCASLSSNDTSEFLGSPAPDFSARTLDNQTITLSKLGGNVVVLDFWATWCVPCRKSLPRMDHLSRDPSLRAQGLRIIAVNYGESKATVENYLASHNLSLQVVRDQDASIAERYQIRELPATVIIGRDGLVRNVLSPVPDASGNEPELDSAIKSALASS
jgi:thiol-disulfide isomerase/thioredoxin